MGDHDPGLPRLQRREALAQRGHHPAPARPRCSRRPAPAAGPSPGLPGRRTRPGTPRRTGPGSVPCRAPTSNSRSRSSYLAASPVAASTYAAGLPRPREVGGPQRGRAQGGEGRRDGGRLRVPDLVELDVGVPLGPRRRRSRRSGRGGAGRGGVARSPSRHSAPAGGDRVGQRRSAGSRATAARGRRTTAPPRAGRAPRCRRSR